METPEQFDVETEDECYEADNVDLSKSDWLRSWKFWLVIGSVSLVLIVFIVWWRQSSPEKIQAVIPAPKAQTDLSAEEAGRKRLAAQVDALYAGSKEGDTPQFETQSQGAGFGPGATPQADPTGLYPNPVTGNGYAANPPSDLTGQTGFRSDVGSSVYPTSTPNQNLPQPAQASDGQPGGVGHPNQGNIPQVDLAARERYLSEFQAAPMVVKIGGRGGHQGTVPTVGLPSPLSRVETTPNFATNLVIPGQRVKAKISQKVLADDGSSVVAVLDEPLSLGNEVLPVGTEVLGEVKGLVSKRIKIEFSLLKNGNRTWNIWAVAQDGRDQADGVQAKQSPDVKPILNQVVRTGVQVIPVVGDKIAQAMNNGGYGNGYAAGGYYDQNGFGFGVNAYNQNGKSKNPNPFYYNGGQVYLLFKDATQRRPPGTPLAPVTPSFPQVNPYQTAGFPTQTIPPQFPGHLPGQTPVGYPTQFPAQPGFPNGGYQQPVQGYQPQPGGPQPVWAPAQPGIR